MADVIQVTGGIVRVTTTEWQALDQAIDISAYDELDLVIGVVSLESAGNLQIKLATGMQKMSGQTDPSSLAGWFQVASFSSIGSAPSWEKIRIASTAGLSRYLRWFVGSLSASAASFTIEGMARRI